MATEESELTLLEELYQRGIANGIQGLEIVDDAGIREREPYCRGIKAIFSPVTGIVDYGIVARSYGEDIKAAAATSRPVARLPGSIARAASRFCTPRRATSKPSM